MRELEKTKPDKRGYVQAHELWSPKEERQVCPGHFCLLKFGKVPGSNRCVEKKFKLVTCDMSTCETENMKPRYYREIVCNKSNHRVLTK